MLATTKALVGKFADHDSREDCFDIHVPVPHSVSAELASPDEFLDVVVEFHEFCEENGIDYNNAGYNAQPDTITIVGLALA